MLRKQLYIALVAQMLTASTVNAGTKVIVKNGEVIPKGVSAQLIEDYGSFKLYDLNSKDALSLTQSNNKTSIANEMNTLLFDAFPFDTQSSTAKINFQSNSQLATGNGLHIIQFVGPIKQSWLDLIESKGAKLIHYVANNGYLVWGSESTRNELDALVSQSSVLQFSAPYTETFKVGKTIQQRIVQQANSNELVNVTVQLADNNNNAQSKQIINNLAVAVESPWNQVMKFHSTRITIKFGDLDQILNLSDSYWVGEYFERTLDDEVQNQILVGDLTLDGSAPAMTGYADFLSNKGFPADPSLYPIVDVTDDGIGDGTTVNGDPTFHEGGDLLNPTRLSYVANCTAASTAESIGGHGHLNTNIVGGYESRVGFPYIDLDGYIRTQGVNPFVRIAGTRIFGPSFNLSACGGTDTGLITSVENNGADIMSNSWGCSGCAGTYDDSSQAFDVGVRDADLSEAGNQELIMVFAAGNAGPSAATVGTPGNGKNVITVGASENFRPSDEDGLWTDGCSTTPTGADNAMDVIGFSSRGPSPGNRTKPEVIAPGTHIHGTASTGTSYDGTGVCDQFRPSGQIEIAASSGTSHSTPAIAGVSSLAYYWLENPPVSLLGNFGTPSPAMMKAYLVAHPTYLTGVDANDDLPSNSQGYGMPNMGLMFDDTSKYIYDQDNVFDNTGESWQWVGSAADPSKPVRIVMTYTDEAGAVGVSPQVNNLDLSVEVGGQTYLGNNFSNEYSVTGGTADAVNNYEAVFFPAGAASDITINVLATNIAGDGVPNTGDGTDQDYALVCYNCTQAPTFTLSSANQNLDVCSPDDAVFNVSVNSVLGFTDPVTLYSIGKPPGALSGFSNNPVVPDGTTNFTVSNLGAVPAGSFPFTINGISGSDNRSIDLNVNLFDNVPVDATLTLPADTATNVSGTATSFGWDAIANATDYLFELSDANNFSNIIESSSTSTNSYTSGLTLSPNSTYYWRVVANNACGSSLTTSEFSFTTANEICFTTTTAIPDNNPVGVDVGLNLIDTGVIQSMEVIIEAEHTWIGDLVFSLTHEDTSTSVVLMDRVGVPASTFGCNDNNINATFDDNGTIPVETACTNTDSNPGISGTVIPQQALSAFSGEDISGAWTLNANDNGGGDTGSITRFCLIPTISDLIFENGFEVTP